MTLTLRPAIDTNIDVSFFVWGMRQLGRDKKLFQRTAFGSRRI